MIPRPFVWFLVVDRAELGLMPGGIRFLCAADLVNLGATSHGFPLKVFIEHLAELAHAEVFFLGIQIGPLEHDRPLSDPVEDAVVEIARFIAGLRPSPDRSGDDNDIDETRPDTY